MMREGKSLRRRGFAVAALTIVLSLAVPELAAPVGAVTARSSRTEMQARAASRPELAARSERSAAGSARKAAAQPSAKVRRARAKRKAARARRARARKGKRTKRKVKRKGKRTVKRTKRQRALAKRRNARKGKRTKARVKRNATAAKKSKGGGKSLSTFGWLEILFFVLLPFLAVAGLLFGTDYQRKPRAPSRQKRKRSLVITPVSRKF
jgi:cobalamin biosynthesis Mg chelatase CobN